jgi:hypothetical protein
VLGVRDFESEGENTEVVGCGGDGGAEDEHADDDDDDDDESESMGEPESSTNVALDTMIVGALSREVDRVS